MTGDIVPDVKNWTWVLQKRCDECGFDASSFEPRDTAAAVLDLGSRWQAVLARPDVAIRLRPDMWSPLEYACHVRDVFRLFVERLNLMLTEDDPLFANWDQDKTAVEDQYARQDPTVVADQLASAAAALSAGFDAVPEDQWDRRGHRSDGSKFTVASFARYFVHDPVHHLWDVQAEVPTY